MNLTQIGQLYDSFPESQQDMPKSEFIKKTMSTLDPTANTKILDHMVQQKRQVTRGRIEQAQIDAALRERRRYGDAQNLSRLGSD